MRTVLIVAAVVVILCLVTRPTTANAQPIYQPVPGPMTEARSGRGHF